MEKEIWVEKEISGHPQVGWCLFLSGSDGTKGISPDPLVTHPPFFYG